MYVVRINYTDREPNFKAFIKRPDAQKLFKAANIRAGDGEITRAILFEVLQTDDPRHAIEVVKAGKASIVAFDSMMEIEKSVGQFMMRLTGNASPESMS